jgi:hypothetical protein
MAAGASAAAGHKPALGKALPSARQAQAGKKFSVAIRVTRATSARFAVTLAGKPIHHSDSFRGGIARSSLLVPAAAGGERLSFKLTARGAGGTATENASYRVRAEPVPALSIGDVTAPEGNSGTTPFVFHVTLSHASTQTVSVGYATQDSDATAGSDYTATSGTLTFKPGTTTETITVPVIGDTAIEPDEEFAVMLSSPRNATVAQGTGTGTITNDDVAAPATPGSYKGATQEGNFVFFTVGGDRSVSGFRVNDISEDCGGGEELNGGVSFNGLILPIATDGSWLAQNTWTGSDTEGDATFTAESWKVSGQFTSATTVTGTIYLADQFTYKGTSYSCASTVTFTAALQG